MRITGVRTRVFEHDLTRRIGDVNCPEGVGRFAASAVLVDTDDGVSGVALGSPSVGGGVQSMATVLVGQDPRSVRGLWHRMLDSAFKGGNEGLTSAAISVLDCALWDLRAKANGVPLWKELGATGNRVKAYASGLDTPLDDEALRDYYARMAGLGISSGKLKVGLRMDDDLRRLQIVQDALRVNDPRPGLMIDANEYWSPKQAVRRVREFERSFDLVWCEEPARRWDYRGLRLVSRSVTTAVATGENLRDVSQYVPLIANEAVDVVQIGAGTTGITGALRVAELAASFELPVAMMSSPGHVMAHAAAVLPNHMMMEVLGGGRDASFTTDALIKDGEIVLGDAPGSGIVFDEDKLDELAAAGASRDTLPGRYRRGPGAGVHEGTREP